MQFYFVHMNDFYISPGGRYAPDFGLRAIVDPSQQITEITFSGWFEKEMKLLTK